MPTREDERRRLRAASLIPVARIVLFFGLFWSIALALFGYGLWISLTVAVIPTAGFLILGHSARTTPKPIHTTLFVALYVLSLTALSFQMGGLVPGVTPWLAAAPMLAATYNRSAGIRPTAAMLFVCVVAIAAWSGFTKTGPYGDQPVAIALQAMSTLGGAIVLYLVARAHARLRDMALEKSYNTNRSLSAELHEHMRTREELAIATKQGLSAAHAAGMAELATGVLHNIGNAINGVNVSASLATERFLPKRAGELRRLQEVLEKESQLTNADPERHRKVASFIAQTLARMRDDDDVFRGEMESLREGLEHVKVIVSTQQRHARSRGLVDEVNLNQMVAQALALTETSVSRTDINVEVALCDLPNIMVDQYKLVQILTNLISNAADAIVQTNARSGNISVHGSSTTTDVVIHVTDSGSGIDADALKRLFEHGFTTKPTGNGFGLHISALAAKELGGSLVATSDGPGHGATFSLTVPRAGRSVTPLPPRRR